MFGYLPGSFRRSDSLAARHRPAAARAVVALATGRARVARTGARATEG
ncbi:hypothetical protein ACIRD2_17765 [Streptomyces sp. NPDC093595]